MFHFCSWEERIGKWSWLPWEEKAEQTLHSLLQHLICLYLCMLVFVFACICVLLYLYLHIYFKAEQTLNLLLQHLIHLTQSSNCEMHSKIAGWGISRIDGKKLVVNNLFVSKPIHFVFFSLKKPSILLPLDMNILFARSYFGVYSGMYLFVTNVKWVVARVTCFNTKWSAFISVS